MNRPSPIRVAHRHVQSADVAFDTKALESLRKDFLLLMKNVDRVATYSDLTKLDQGVRLWRKYYDGVVQSILKGMTNTLWKVFTGETRYNDAFDAQVKDAFKYWDTKIRAGYWGLYIEMGSIPSESLQSVAKWEGRVTTEQDILAKWMQKKKAWSDKVKRAARTAWTVLNEYIVYASQRPEGVAPVRDVPEVHMQEVSGFSVTFESVEGDQDYKVRSRDALKLGLAHYRERAAKVFPLLLGPAKLPIFFRGNDKINCGGKYEGDRIVVCPLHEPPKEYAHVIAHEMGHHVYRTYLSSTDQEFWSHAIKQDYTSANLNDILDAWEPTEWEDDVVARLAKTDPVLALQIAGLAWENEWGPRKDAEDYLAKNGPNVNVPLHPVTGYATKNPEEAFCEALGRLVSYGPRAVDPTVLSWMRTILPREIKVATKAVPSALRIAAIKWASQVSVTVDLPKTMAARQSHPMHPELVIATFEQSFPLYRLFDGQELQRILTTGKITGGNYSVKAERAFGASWGSNISGVITFGNLARGKRLGADLYLAKLDAFGFTFAHLDPEFVVDPDGPDEQPMKMNSARCSLGLGCSLMNVGVGDVDAFYKVLPNDQIERLTLQELRGL